ncbi:Chromosomal replication initiator protein DnaA [Desulfarculales bacterium]
MKFILSVPDAWLGASKQLRSLVSPQEFDTWFTPLNLRLEDENLAVVLVPNRFYADWIRERYGSILDHALSQTVGQKLTVAYEVARALLTHRLPMASTSLPTALAASLNPRYTFATFVGGNCNELARAACLAVAEQPGRQYNPLFIFGETGLGKTHLITAVGNHFLQYHPSVRIHYGSAEVFTNDLIQAMYFDGIGCFHKKYRQLNCLLLDDIQFLADREYTQEEFFHTFNALYQAGKQIVVTCDKMSKDIPSLEKRLRTRFEWGLMVDLQPPDEETKIAILQKKAEERGLALSHKVAGFLAKQPEANMRVLEGYLTRIIAISSFQGVEVTLDLVKRVVGPLISERRVSIEEVLSTVAGQFGVKVSDLKGFRKTRKVSQPRQVAMYLARRLTRSSFPEIGRYFGGKDHSTIIKGVKKIEEMLRENPELAELIRSTERLLTEGGLPSTAKLKDGGM